MGLRNIKARQDASAKETSRGTKYWSLRQQLGLLPLPCLQGRETAGTERGRSSSIVGVEKP